MLDNYSVQHVEMTLPYNSGRMTADQGKKHEIYFYLNCSVGNFLKYECIFLQHFNQKNTL